MLKVANVTALGSFHAPNATKLSKGTAVDVLLRAEHLIEDEFGNITAVVKERLYRGSRILYTLDTGDAGEVLSYLPNHRRLDIGASVRLRADTDAVACFAR